MRQSSPFTRIGPDTDQFVDDLADSSCLIDGEEPASDFAGLHFTPVRFGHSHYFCLVPQYTP
jgi:hypothetical protein